MQPFLIDTSLVSFLIREEPVVMRRVRQQITLFGYLSISMITYYEVIRGWDTLASSSIEAERRYARERLRLFDDFITKIAVLPLTPASCQNAARIYGLWQRDKRRIQKNVELDILIAGTAIENGYGVATANVKDFEEIPGLTVENWLLD